MSLQFLRNSVLIILIMTIAGVSFAATHVISTNEELLEATQTAVDGDLVLFLTGEYETVGQFTALVTLRGDTGDPEDIVVAMAEDSWGLVDVSGSSGDFSLRLESITFRSPDSWEALLDVFSASVVIQDCIFENIGAFQNGAVLSARSCDVLVENSSFRYNSVPSSCTGGAIYLDEGSLNITGCSFSENYGGEDGGAMALEGCSLSMADCSFSGNQTMIHGGGLYLSGVTGTIVDSTFENNIGMVAGGGLAVEGGSSIDMARCVITGNGSYTVGAGIYITGASYAALSYCQILENNHFSYSDGLVEEYSSALLHCCEMDEEYWTINGEVEIDNEGCAVATQLETFDSLKALYR